MLHLRCNHTNASKHCPSCKTVQAYVQRTTAKSGVTEKVSDDATIAQAAGLIKHAIQSR